MAKKKKNKKKTAPQPRAPEPKPACQLYLITPPVIEDLDKFADDLRAALSAAPDDAPVASVQIRLKNPDNSPIDSSALIQAANVIVPIAHEYGAVALINDHPELVEQCNADGAHIGQGDMDYLSSRDMLGADAILGVTCHNSRELAFNAASSGADYVAFGAFFETQTKTVIAKAELELLSWWSETIEVPCVAIGGITVGNCAPLIAAGADFLAVCSGVWNHEGGPAAAVAAFTAQF
ncbi:MAG: thiamine phosphate synthase [Robiginitomaculum sp.]